MISQYKIIILIFILFFFAVPATKLSASPYTLDPVTDGSLAAGGLALYGLTYYTSKYADPLKDDEIASLSDSDVNPFDRPATENFSENADRWSDIILTTNIASPLFLFINSEIRSDAIIIGVMYAESFLITDALCGNVKNLVHRNRPFTYNPDAPLQDKKEKDAVRSFYSGHTSKAFNSAVFLATVFSDYNPDSRWRYAVWGVSLTAASLTGYLRYRAGKHYPTDILAGAAAGSFTGYMVPALHRNNVNGISILIIPGTESVAAVSIKF